MIVLPLISIVYSLFTYSLAKYPFTANDANQLTLKVGDVLEVKQENGGWFRGYLLGGPPNLRLFPKSYVEYTPQYELEAEAPPPPPGSPSPNQTPVMSPQPGIAQAATPTAQVASSTPAYHGGMGGPAATQQAYAQGVNPSMQYDQAMAMQHANQYQTLRQQHAAAASNAIPIYNPEPRAKPTNTPQATAAPVVFVPTVHSDFRDKEHGYLLVKSPNDAPYNPEVNNILEVVDSHRVVDPVTSQDMLIDDLNISIRGLTENANDPLIQLRHAQHQSLTLPVEATLRDDDGTAPVVPSQSTAGGAAAASSPQQQRRSLHSSSSSTTATAASTTKKGKTSETLNMATPEVIRAVYPPINTESLYGAGDNSLPSKKYQLFLQVNVCIFSVNEWTELYFSLYSASKGEYITEDYVVLLPAPGKPEHGTILGRMKTLFRDIDPADLKSDLWLVCRIYRNAGLEKSDKLDNKADGLKKSVDNSRRAFGCAATCISDANLHLQLGRKYEPPPNQLTIYVPASEHAFPRFHDMLVKRARGEIRADSREIETVPKAKGIALCLTMFQGEVNHVREQNRSLLRDVVDTFKVRPPRFWDIRQTRCDLYVTLHDVFALQEKKASPRNIEVRVWLVHKYQEVPNALYRGSGDEPITTFTSAIYYHTNNPSFGETFKIRAPANILNEAHLYFELWHISSNPKKHTLFSVAVLPLTSDNGAFLENREHSITTCKPFSREEAYLSDAFKTRLTYKKGETIRISTQLISTSLTPNHVITALASWKIVSQQVLTANLNALMHNKALVVEGHDLRRSFKEVIQILLGIASGNYPDTHVLSIEALTFVLARLAQDAVPMVDTYCQYLVSDVSVFHKLLGYLLGTLANHTDNILQSVAAANSASSPTAATSGGGSPFDPRPSLVPANTSGPASPSHVRTNTPLSMPSTPGGSLGGRLLNFDDASDFSSTTRNALVSSTSTGNLGSGSGQGNSIELGVSGVEHPPLVRFALALPYLMRLVASVFTIHERKGSKAPSLQQLAPAKPATITGTLPSTVILPIEDTITRDEFKQHITTLFGYINQILEQHLQPDKHRSIHHTQSILLKAYPSLLMALTIHEHDTASLCGVFTPEEAQKLLVNALVSTANHPSLALDQLHGIQSCLTGVTGMLQPPNEVLASVVQNGWCRHTTSFARSWLYLPRSSRSRVLTTSQIKAVLPQFITTISDAVTISLKRASLSETYSAVIIAQHLYSLAFSHTYRTQTDVEAHPYLRMAQGKSNLTSVGNDASSFNPLKSAYCTDFAVTYPIDEGGDAGAGDTAATTTTTTEAKITFQDVLPLLPCLVNALAYYVSSYPGMNTPKTDASLQTTFNLLEPRVANTAFVDILPDLAVLVFGLVKQTTESDFMQFIKQLPVEATGVFVSRLLFVSNTLAAYNLFPPQWIALEMFQISSLIHILKLTARVLKEKFIGLHFNSQIWVYWFQLGLECQQSSLLISELQPIVRKVFISEQYGSLREGLTDLFTTMWRDLDRRSLRQCISTFVERLLHYACHSIVTDVKTMSLAMYFDLLQAEYAADGSFNECERCTIDACYEIMNTSPERGSLVTSLLISTMNHKFDSGDDEALKKAGMDFLTHLDNLFSLMSSLFNFPEDPAYESDRTSVALRLIRYIEKTNDKVSTSSSSASTKRKAMHSRYIQYLVDLHIGNRNFVEAGITLIQQAKLLDWTHTTMDAYGEYPVETETLRKERLLKLAITSFAKAQDFERCIQIIDYLRYYYQMMTYDYKSLSSLINQQSKFFHQIITTTRVYSNYYRVVFYGDFDTAQLENGTEYVYRGNLLESLMDFTSRLKARYQQTHFHMSTDRPSDELLAQHSRIISVGLLNVPSIEQRNDILRQTRAKVKPSESDTMISWRFSSGQCTIDPSSLKRPTDMPENTHSSEPSAIATYRDNNNICVFEYSRPWRRTDEKNPSNEFKHLWLIRNYVILEEPFPSNRRRIPVIERVEKIMKPIQCAVETINNKSRELMATMAEVSQTPSDETADVRKLSMTLNGMIDAAVNGGNMKYIEAFLTPEFVSAEAVTLEDELVDVQHTLQERRHYQEELRSALKYQLEVLQEGLIVYGQRGDKSQLGLYEHLINMYNRSRTTMAEILG